MIFYRFLLFIIFSNIRICIKIRCFYKNFTRFSRWRVVVKYREKTFFLCRSYAHVYYCFVVSLLQFLFCGFCFGFVLLWYISVGLRFICLFPKKFLAQWCHPFKKTNRSKQPVSRNKNKNGTFNRPRSTPFNTNNLWPFKNTNPSFLVNCLY